MRALIVIALLGFGIGRAEAGCENSTLVVRDNSGAAIKVYIDGETGSNPPTQAVTVTELTPGSHTLKVVAVSTDNDGQTHRHTVFNGTIEVHTSVYMNAHVEEHKGVSIHETKEACGDKPTVGVDDGYSTPTDNAGTAVTAPGATHNESQEAVVSDNQPARAMTPPVVTGNLPPHISDDDFYRIKSAIIATPYEVKKVDTLKLLVRDRQFATSQVGELMNLFAFESNKLMVAKLLYYQTVDKQNYSRLADNFNFDERKDDFKQFLKGK